MFQDSVPAGSYNDPFLSSVCVCMCVCVHMSNIVNNILYVYNRVYILYIYDYMILYDVYQCISMYINVYHIYAYTFLEGSLSTSSLSIVALNLEHTFATPAKS